MLITIPAAEGWWWIVVILVLQQYYYRVYCECSLVVQWVSTFVKRKAGTIWKPQTPTACLSLIVDAVETQHTVSPFVKEGKWRGFKNLPTVHCLMQCIAHEWTCTAFALLAFCLDKYLSHHHLRHCTLVTRSVGIRQNSAMSPLSGRKKAGWWLVPRRGRSWCRVSPD